MDIADAKKCSNLQKFHEVIRMLPRKEYLDKLVRKKDNGRVKVVVMLKTNFRSLSVSVMSLVQQRRHLYQQ